MSEEEIFKTLEKACILDEDCYEVDCLFEKDLIAIRELIKLYKNQQKEIEELHKEINRRIKLKIENEKCLDRDFIYKGKIRQKIKEVQETMCPNCCACGLCDEFKELLEGK